MTDPETPEHPEIAALLRASRAEEPLPAEVADRLDDVIAGLAADRATSTHVVPLRRRLSRIGAAAAAFVLLAGGAVLASGLLHEGSGSGSSARPTTLNAPQHPTTGSRETQKSPQKSTQDSVQGLANGTAAQPSLRRAHLRHDVLDLLAGRAGARAGDDSAARSPVPLSGCRSPAGTPAEATVRGVSLDGVPAVLVVPAGGGASVVARVYSCDGSAVLARATLAAQ